MTESLAAFQSGLWRALRGDGDYAIDTQSAGFRFTIAVRRSWCEGRTFMAARTVLSLMVDEEKRRLVGEYVDHGGGTRLSLAAEREAFLAFLAPHLPDPSHALTICQMDQALTRARLAASTFVRSRQHIKGRRVGRGRCAALVWFYTDPNSLIMALKGREVPLVGPPEQAVLIAPGLPNLFRTATDAEVELWDRLPLVDAPLSIVDPLLMEGVLAYLA